MRILVIGGGGREHAIVWKLKQSTKVDKIYCIPGNAGISDIAECIDIPINRIQELTAFAIDNNIDLIVIGPEVPLVAGIVDEFKKSGLRCFGPGSDAAIIEGSKVFSKQLMKKYNIPTAAYGEFSSPDEAKTYLKNTQYPVVVKADGLAAGKGVIIAQDYKGACYAVTEIMEDKIFKSSGDSIIIEEFLEGPEVSVLAFTDGITVSPMVSARDHKRIFDNDQGPNTGGMGTISPAPGYTDEIASTCMDKIFMPTINAMNIEGRTFKGVLFFGLILTKEGPKCLEYNCRFGDPETQVVLPRLKTDLTSIMNSVIDGTLEGLNIEWDERAASCIIASSGGYPGDYVIGKPIYGLDRLSDDIIVFHSGTKLSEDKVVTHGGRVLGVTAMGHSVKESSDRVYDVIENISFDGMYYRKDIGVK